MPKIDSVQKYLAGTALTTRQADNKRAGSIALARGTDSLAAISNLPINEQHS